MPGTANWPRFVRNRSEQFEGRFSLVEILQSSPSVLLDGMEGSCLPIAVAHGEGRAEFANEARGERLRVLQRAGRRCATSRQSRSVATSYPANPNGSPFGIAAITSSDGRVTLTMPHPERSFRDAQNSWRPDGAGECSGWYAHVRQCEALGRLGRGGLRLARFFELPRELRFFLPGLLQRGR